MGLVRVAVVASKGRRRALVWNVACVRDTPKGAALHGSVFNVARVKHGGGQKSAPEWEGL
jgi:hypothetical protein